MKRIKDIVFYFLTVVCLMLAGCEKREDPVPIAEKPLPEFTLFGTLGGNDLKINAGEDGFYMNTRDTFFGPPLNTYKFTGEFAGNGCRKCPNSFNITFNDFKANANGNPSFIDSVLQPGKKLLFSRPQTLSYGRAFVSWIDPAGRLFHTENLKQPANNRFSIISVEEYHENLSGRKTKKLIASFSCRLYTQSGDSIDFNNVSTTFAVSYP